MPLIWLWVLAAWPLSRIARRWRGMNWTVPASREDLRHSIQVITTREQADPAYQANDAQRCFHCKTHLFTALENLPQVTDSQVVDIEWHECG